MSEAESNSLGQSCRQAWIYRGPIDHDKKSYFSSNNVCVWITLLSRNKILVIEIKLFTMIFRNSALFLIKST